VSAPTPPAPTAPANRPERSVVANSWLVARREFRERVRGRLFFVSTLVLAGLAMFVAVLPVAAKLIDRGSVTTVAVVSTDPELSRQTRGVLASMLNSSGSEFDLIAASDEQTAVAQVADRELDAAVIAKRRPDGQLGFSFHLGETMGQQQIGTLSLGVFGVAVIFSDQLSLAGSMASAAARATVCVSSSRPAGSSTLTSRCAAAANKIGSFSDRAAWTARSAATSARPKSSSFFRSDEVAL